MSQPEISLGRFVAGSSFAEKAFRFVKFATGKLALCGAGEAGLGVIQDEPVAGEPGNVMRIGITKVRCGGSISQGSNVKSDANGKAVAASTSDPFSFGMALENGADGELIDVFLTGAPGVGIERYQFTFPALGTNVDGSYAVFRAPFDLTIQGAAITLVADLTGAATNHRKYEFINKSLDGNGATVIADLAFDSGVNANDFDEKALTLSSTPANLNIDAGQIVAFVSSTPGTGIADPGGLGILTFVRR